jgi:hypothetical protein
MRIRDTPSATVAYAPPPPRATTIELPSRDETLRRWQLPPNDPWAPYAKYTLLSAMDPSRQDVTLPDVMSLDDVRRAYEAGRRVGAAGIPPDIMLVVDLRGAASVAFGVGLSAAARQPVSLGPTFNNWPAQDELVPAEETLAALATLSPRVADGDGGPTTPVFLLDSWRLAYRYDDPGDETYDNRYVLSSSDLPDIATLRARGIQRVAYVVESLDDTGVEEDDVHAPFLDWERWGVPIAMVDLDLLDRPTRLDWDELFADDELVVRPRLTLLDDPLFYLRARGGFGGIYARPSPIFVGGVWTTGGGGGWSWRGGGGGG